LDVRDSDEEKLAPPLAQLLALSFTEQGNRKSHDHPEEGQVATLVIRRARAAPMRFRRKLPQQLL